MYRNLKTCIFTIPLALLVAASVPAFGATEITPQEKKLIRAAKKEGTATFLNPWLQDPTARAMGVAFRKHYGLGSGFKFNSIRKGTGATVATARQEIKAGKFTFDAVMAPHAGFYYAAAKRGAFAKLDSGHWKNHADVATNAGQIYNYPYFLAVYAYTFQPVWNVGCPGTKGLNITSYADYKKPIFKNKTITSDISKSGSYSITTVALEEAGFDIRGLWKTYKATNPILMFRTEPKMQTVINCERPVDMWNISGRVFQNIQKKPELAKVLRWGTYKEGQVLLGQQIAVPKGVKHPSAGKLFVEFMLTREGADVFVSHEISVYTFLKGYKPPASAKKYQMDLTKVKIIGMKDWVAGTKKFKKIRAAWSKVYK